LLIAPVRACRVQRFRFSAVRGRKFRVCETLVELPRYRRVTTGPHGYLQDVRDESISRLLPRFCGAVDGLEEIL
jgi:hypothetical protein